MDGVSPIAPLERSVSELSAASSRSHRSTVRGTRRKLLSTQSSGSASSINDKSLTSFPSFSPGPPKEEGDESPVIVDGIDAVASILIKQPSSAKSRTPMSAAQTPASTTSASTAASIVESLTAASPGLLKTRRSSSGRNGARSALFDDTAGTPTRRLPGALHLADNDHIKRLVAKHGAVGLVRQIAEDLAQRDAQISALRTRAGERERALRRIILECGLSNLDLETRLRAVEDEARTMGAARRGGLERGVSDLVSDAMADSVSGDAPPSPFYGHATPFDGQATIRAVSGSTQPPATESDGNSNNSKGTMKFIKDYIWGGGGSGRNSRASSINGDTAKQAQTVIRAPVSSDRRPMLQDDLFTPPDTQSVRSSSRASSINNGVTGRKTSTPFSTLVRMVAGGGSLAPKDGDLRGRAGSSSVAGGSLRTSSVSSQRTTGSNRAVSTQAGGPKALMSMRRVVTGVPNLPASGASRSKPEERWDSMVSSPITDSMSQQESYGPVEMDKIVPLEAQPPTLSQFYNNNYGGSGHLTDRFGFIYDQRRKKRQRAAHLASQVLVAAAGGKADGAGRPILSPIITDNSTSHKWDVVDDGRPGSPSSAEEVREEGKPSSRWYDYLKVVTFQAGTERTTELLSDTPAMSVPGIEVTEGQEPPKSPVIVQSEDGGFVPHASTPISAVDTLASASAGPEGEPAAATFVKDDVEPVKQLLDQLNSLHDVLQRKRMDRWNEFQRKVRAERRKHGGESSGADNRFHSMPETRLADGELIGIADLGNKGKVGRAKWSEFRTLVLGGIPVLLRAKVWAECSGAIDLRVPGYYDDLIKRPATEDNAEVVTQIRADINRTLTDNIFFRKGVGVERLHEVLLAYSRRNADVGYCQGMNLIAANLLLVTPSAEDAFWLLASVVERILPVGYYDHSLLASRADQQVLRRYVSELLPRLSAHFEALGIDLETMTFQWFLSVFTDCLSAEALFRVWDVMLCLADGSTFLFQVALALLKLNEQQLLTQCPTPAAVYTYINHQMTDHAISIDGLIQASEGLKRLVRREDVSARREAAMEAERGLARLRDEERAARAAAALTVRGSRKAAAAAALVVTDEVVSAASSRAPSVIISRTASPAPSALASPAVEVGGGGGIAGSA
ncbi:hypothetical protein RB598_009278 [Gaeumannomyces tritici]